MLELRNTNHHAFLYGIYDHLSSLQFVVKKRREARMYALRRPQCTASLFQIGALIFKYGIDASNLDLDAPPTQAVKTTIFYQGPQAAKYRGTTTPIWKTKQTLTLHTSSEQSSPFLTIGQFVSRSDFRKNCTHFYLLCRLIVVNKTCLYAVFKQYFTVLGLPTNTAS